MSAELPEAAVRAASWAVLRGINAQHHAYKIAHAALEAAAPHLMAEAWDEGNIACNFAPDYVTNPYRGQP